MFYRCSLDLSSFFSPLNLRGRLADRHRTLPHVRRWQIYKIRSEIWVATSPQIWQPKNFKISARFRTTSQLDREYLRNATRHRQSENGVANNGQSPHIRCTLIHKRRKIGPKFWSTQRAAIRLGTATHLVGSVLRQWPFCLKKLDLVLLQLATVQYFSYLACVCNTQSVL